MSDEQVTGHSWAASLVENIKSQDQNAVVEFTSGMYQVANLGAEGAGLPQRVGVQMAALEILAQEAVHLGNAAPVEGLSPEEHREEMLLGVDLVLREMVKRVVEQEAKPQQVANDTDQEPQEAAED